MSQTEAVRIPLPPTGGVLHGRLRRPARDVRSRGAVVLCHPHPDFGGNMDVWLLPVIGEALAADGWTVLRFDFRSVGTGVDPTGHRDGHAPERADLAATIAFLRERQLLTPGQRLCLAGWSFGALVALLHGMDEPGVTDWVGIAPATQPLPQLPMAPLPSEQIRRWSARRLVIAGRHDQFFPPDTMALLHPHQTLMVDSDHFLFDCDQEVAALIVAGLADAGPAR